MFATVTLIFIAGLILLISVMRFIFSVRKLAAGEHDTRGHKAPNRQDKPPLVFWTVASTVIAVTCVLLVVLAIN